MFFLYGCACLSFSDPLSYEIFKVFKGMVENFFSRKVKSIRYDKEREYIKYILSVIFNQRGFE